MVLFFRERSFIRSIDSKDHGVVGVRGPLQKVSLGPVANSKLRAKRLRHVERFLSKDRVRSYPVLNLVVAAKVVWHVGRGPTVPVLFQLVNRLRSGPCTKDFGLRRIRQVRACVTSLSDFGLCQFRVWGILLVSHGSRYYGYLVLGLAVGCNVQDASKVRYGHHGTHFHYLHPVG